MSGKIVFVASVLAIFFGIATVVLSSSVSLSLIPVASASVTSSGDLAIPYVDPSTLAVDPAGASTVGAYIDYFTNHVQGVSFDYKQFSSVLKSKDGVILLPPELADKALADSNFQEVHNSLVVAKNFLDAKIAFEKAIKVTGAAVSLSQEMVGFDELTEILIQNTLNTEAGAMSKSDLQSYLTRFYQTASDEHTKIANQVISMENDDSPWTRFLKHLGFLPTARAQLPPFGGLITQIVDCNCASGYLVAISPPVPTILFVPYGFLSSPLFYEYHQMAVGIWWLGLRTGALIPCIAFDSEGVCSLRGAGYLIYMTGTSGGSGGGGGGGGAPVCGNGVCEVGETPASCPVDCGSGTGVCRPVTSGPCSIANLSKTCFAKSAAQWSSVCNVESNGNPRIGSGIDKTVDGQSVSWGLFQINKTVTPVPPGSVGASGKVYAGGLDCPSAFSGPYTGRSSRVTIVDPGLYNSCVDANQNPDTNINEACALSKNGTNFGPWYTTAKKCGFLL